MDYGYGGGVIPCILCVLVKKQSALGSSHVVNTTIHHAVVDLPNVYVTFDL